MFIHFVSCFCSDTIFHDKNAKTDLFLSQVQLTLDTMTNKGKKKANIVDYDSDEEVVEAPTRRIEIIYEDTKAINGAKLEFKWGQIYHWLVESKVPEARLEDLALYDNILRSGITKVTTRLEMLPCAEVIGWILPRIDTTGMLMNDVENKGFASLHLHFYQ